MIQTRNLKQHHSQDCGEGGIRTLDRVAPTTVFETAAFNHSATSPDFGIMY